MSGENILISSLNLLNLCVTTTLTMTAEVLINS